VKADLLNDPSMRLSDDELVDQCSTFLLAGSDSVSAALAWSLYLLAQHPEMQTRLRDEILSSEIFLENQLFDTDADIESDSRTPPPSYYTPEERWAALDALPYLNGIVRETLRVCPSIHSTIRVATSDDQIPVSHPVTLRDGTVVKTDEYITIRKGSYVVIPIESINLSEEIWGSDAREFKYVSPCTRV
jgi:cytochrome P450